MYIDEAINLLKILIWENEKVVVVDTEALSGLSRKEYPIQWNL